MVPPVDPSRIAAVLADFTELLLHDVKYPGWHNETALKKAFYIRGYTWFEETVLKKIPMNITACAPEIRRAKEILAARHDWKSDSFSWNNPLALSQITYGVSNHKRKPLLFHKAVETIVVFEAISERLVGFSPTDVYGHLRIEPAVSYVNDFNRTTIDMMKSRDPDVFEKLLNFTGQDTITVFYEMADNKTVTHKLAEKVRLFIRNNYRDIQIGEVGFRLNNRNDFNPSRSENLS